MAENLRASGEAAKLLLVKKPELVARAVPLKARVGRVLSILVALGKDTRRAMGFVNMVAVVFFGCCFV